MNHIEDGFESYVMRCGRFAYRLLATKNDERCRQIVAKFQQPSNIRPARHHSFSSFSGRYRFHGEQPGTAFRAEP